MEKYGVQIDNEKVKTAGVSKSCPKCGMSLEIDPNSAPLPKCPRCGTEPWEKTPPPQSQTK